MSDVDGEAEKFSLSKLLTPELVTRMNITPELTIHSVNGVGALVSAVTDLSSSITAITITNGGAGYSVYDGVSASARFDMFQEEITLAATAHDPYDQMSSMYFGVNGVPLMDVNQTGMSLVSSYTPMDLVPLFFTVSFDSQSNTIGDWTYGWQPSWLLQHHHQGGLSAPQWYWGNPDYWPHPAPWQTMPLPLVQRLQKLYVRTSQKS